MIKIKERKTVKLVKNIKVKNALGLHIRPAALIVKILQLSKSSVFFTYKKETVNARSIMNILTLAAKKNSEITITVKGDDAAFTMEALIEAFESCFEE